MTPFRARMTGLLFALLEKTFPDNLADPLVLMAAAVVKNVLPVNVVPDADTTATCQGSVVGNTIALSGYKRIGQSSNGFDERIFVSGRNSDLINGSHTRLTQQY